MVLSFHLSKLIIRYSLQKRLKTGFPPPRVRQRFINLNFITTLIGSIGLAVGIGTQAKEVICKRLHGHALDCSLSLSLSLLAQRTVLYLRLSLIPGKLQDEKTGLQIRWGLDWQGGYSFVCESISSICNEKRHCSGLVMESREKIVNFCVDHGTASIENGETCSKQPDGS